MDQNYQPYSFYQEEQPVKNAAYYRMEARKARKGKWVLAAVAYFLFTMIPALVAIVAMIPMMISIIPLAIAQSETIPTTFFPTFIISYVLLFAVIIFIMAPFTVGIHRVGLDLIDGKAVRFETLFAYFKKGYLSSVATHMLSVLLVAVAMIPALIAAVASTAVIALAPAVAPLLAVLFMLIGLPLSIFLAIVITYRYSLAYFILAEYPTLGAIDVLRNSAALMKGRKWKYFCLQISFIGWALLLIPLDLITCGVGSLIGQNVLYAYIYTAQAAFYHDVAKRDAANDVEFPSLDPNDYNPDADCKRPL